MRPEPVARTGPRPDTALPLAGSAAIWFDTVRQGGALRPAAELDPATITRLSAPRPALCGLPLDRPLVMGILNVTPDSFSDGGDNVAPAAALQRAREMADEADIIDIGGESTRPGAQIVPEDEEIRRTAPIIRAVREAGITTPISIDTRKARVVQAALDAGADMVNDVSALGYDPDLAPLVAERGVPVVLMHAQGTPETMQDNPTYGDVVADVTDALAAAIDTATAAGIGVENIVTDPGIGFGKTMEHNLALLHHLAVLHDLGCPVLLGASRKRFIGTIGNAPEAKDRLGGSLAVALHGIRQGVQIVRVHDTKATKQAFALWSALEEGGDE